MSGRQPEQGVPGPRIRVRYTVGGKVRFLSHRDVARVMERAIKRAGIPVAYTLGYSPRPKVQYGLALSTGYESDGEYVDIHLDPHREGITDPAEMALALTACLPEGLDVTATGEVAPGEGSLQDSVESTSWVAHVREIAHGQLSARVDALLTAPSYEIEIIRKGKPVREDLRPLLIELSVAAGDRHCVLSAELGTKPRSIRPSELLEVLGVRDPQIVRRTHQWTRRAGIRGEPLGLDDAAPRAGLCAS